LSLRVFRFYSVGRIVCSPFRSSFLVFLNCKSDGKSFLFLPKLTIHALFARSSCRLWSLLLIMYPPLFLRAMIVAYTVNLIFFQAVWICRLTSLIRSPL